MARTAIFWQEGFPSVDTKEISKTALETSLTNLNPEFLNQSDLGLKLNATDYDLLVLPYGSAFPEDAWPAIKEYIKNGGNLLVLGGKPFSVPISADLKTYGLKDLKTTLTFGKELLINDTFEIPSNRLTQITHQESNENFKFLDLPSVDFERAFAMTIRLSSKDMYNRLGSWGSIDAKWEGLLYGVDPANHKLAALASYVDHFQNQLVGSRWVFANFEPKAGYWESPKGKELIQNLAQFAAQGAIGFKAMPTKANYRAKEKAAIRVTFENPKIKKQSFEISLDLIRKGQVVETLKKFRGFQAEHLEDTFKFKTDLKSGFYEVLISIKKGTDSKESVPFTYKTGFWREDLKALAKGKSFGANATYLTRDGKSYPVVGTTYMASDVHRYFLLTPNPYVFEKDFAQLEAAGLNMIRTGTWTGYDQMTNSDGSAKEETLRALEAFLLSAKTHHMPVQFCFFSFIPDIFGGKNPYLDPETKQKQKNYILSFVNRFKNNPGLMWDLLNEPSFSNPSQLFNGNVSNKDEIELAAWNGWLMKRHGSRENMAKAWNMSEALLKETLTPEGLIPLPNSWETKVNWNAIYWGWTKPLKAYDYNLFAQEKFNEWAKEMAASIRVTGSKQLITVGQDEGGVTNRILNQFYGDTVDFTTNHSWWLNDALLWDSLAAKTPTKPNLIQETGIMHTETPQETSRMDEEGKAKLLERKCALALGANGAGVIQWAWNINTYMKDDNEATIGAVRGDGTEKPEADVLRRFADFLREAAPYFSPPETPKIALILPQSLQLSLYNDLYVEATQKAVRALGYYAKTDFLTVSESDLSVNAKLFILPSAQILSESAWQNLLEKVEQGSTLLITGPIDRDEYFQPVPRLATLNPNFKTQTLTAREATLELDSNNSKLKIQNSKLLFSYSGHKKDRADLEYIEGTTKLEEIPYGKGKILICPFPAELNDNLLSIGELYKAAIAKAEIQPTFTTDNTNPGILIRQTVFPKAILYLVASETNTDQTVTIMDAIANQSFKVNVPAEHSILLLLDKKTGNLLAKYQPEPF